MVNLMVDPPATFLFNLSVQIDAEQVALAPETAAPLTVAVVLRVPEGSMM